MERAGDTLWRRKRQRSNTFGWSVSDGEDHSNSRRGRCALHGMFVRVLGGYGVLLHCNNVNSIWYFLCGYWFRRKRIPI